jgi:glyoxylase-like metal-dependent hydrolase (beta-lactamase superfamily II)
LPIHRVDEHIDLIELSTGNVSGFLSAYLVRGEKAAIIDPGPVSTARQLLDSLRDLGVERADVKYIAASHVHLDHAGGTEFLMRELPEAELVVHRRGAPHMVRPEMLWKDSKRVIGDAAAAMYGRPEGVPQDRVITAGEGMKIELGGGVELTVLETPGHASHCLSFHDERSRGIFTGDAAGLYLAACDAVLPTTPPPFHLGLALDSLKKIGSLRPERIYYAHFGFAYDGVEKVRVHGEQLRLWHTLVGEMVEEGLSADEMLERLKEEDGMLRAAEGVLESNPMFKGNMMLSLYGLLGHRPGQT